MRDAELRPDAECRKGTLVRGQEASGEMDAECG